MLRRAERVTIGSVGQIIIRQIPAAVHPLFAAMIGLVKYDHGSSPGALNLSRLHTCTAVGVESGRRQRAQQ